MTQTVQKGRRRGGRTERKAARAAGANGDQSPVQGGLSGGQYKPLSEAEVARIHEAALTLLEEVGMADAIPSCVDFCTQAGATMGTDGRLRFPRAMVDDMLARAGRRFVFHGQTPRHDIEPWGTRVYFGTAGAAVSVHEPATNTYRPSTVRDLYDSARFVEALDNIHFLQRPLVATDVEDILEFDVNTLYACISGTSKPVGTSHVLPEHVTRTLEMLHTVAGSEHAWRARPFVLQSNCFVVPPMKFAQDACACLEVAVRGGMPVLLLSAGQAGATSPAALAGAIVQATAEVLAATVYVNAIRPGHPCFFGLMPFVSDLRTGAMSGGSGEQALMTAACAQMAQFYDLPCVSAAGMADSKEPDAQSGYEKGITNVMAGLAGLNMVYEAAGMQASILGFSFESLIIDNDMLGQCLRAVRGIEVTDETLSLDVIRDVCMNGPGHYLGHGQTLELMQSEYVYPKLANRMSPKEWLEADRPNLLAEAQLRAQTLRTTFFPDHISDAVDDVLRAAHPIRLDRQHMKPA